jgi:hypothetical protein
MTCKLSGWEIRGEINTVKYLIPQPKIPSIHILKDHAVLLSKQPLFQIPKRDKLTVTTPFYPVSTTGLLTSWRRSLNLKLNKSRVEVKNSHAVPPTIIKLSGVALI